jgi:hypothetical protein
VVLPNKQNSLDHFVALHFNKQITYLNMIENKTDIQSCW